MSQSSNNKSGWAKLLADFKVSGLTQRAFCEREGLKFDTFKYHHYRQRKQAKSTSEKLLPVRTMALPLPSTAFVLRLPTGVELKVPVQFDPESLKSLLSLLKD